MPRQAATTIQSNFVRGLITETTPLKFPEDCVTEAWDCFFDKTGRITRRPAFDFETGATQNTVTPSTDEAFSEYIWTSVAGDGSRSFLVLQRDSTLYFYDLSSSVTTISGNKKSFTLSLTSFVPSGSAKSPTTYACKYTQGNGNLIVVNPACDPFYVSYTSASDTVSGTAITLKMRDFTGLSAGIADNNRPTETVATLKTNNPSHYYNLLNQGWHATDALSQWDTARSDMPSNQDTVALFRSSQTDAFDNTLVTSKASGNTLSPKGHFILTATAPNRNTAMTDEGFTGATISTSTVNISQSAGSIINDSTGWTNTSNAFDSSTSQASGSCAVHSSTAAASYLGKDFGGTPYNIYSAVVTPSTDVGFLNGSGGAGTGNVTLQLRASNSAPASASSGTLLGSVGPFADTTTAQTITSSDAVTQYRYVWISITAATTSAFAAYDICEIVFATSVGVGSGTFGISTSLTYERPSTIEFYAGRVWYAGINDLGLANSIFFSQIILSGNQYGRCYQANDPTAEQLNDLLADDGGVIVIPELAQVTHIMQFQGTLLVFATNGVWTISGSTAGSFSATDYTIKRISNLGTNSFLSFINMKGTPLWWGENGILTVMYNPNYNSYTVENISYSTIQTFFLSIPERNRQYIKASYDSLNDLVYFLYNGNSSITSADYYKYNRILILNGQTKAFFPYTITTSSTKPFIRGIVYAQDALRSTPSKIKFVTSTANGSNEDISFAELRGTGLLDWPTFSGGTDYSSYFVTGHRVHGDTQRYFQNNYVFVFLDTVADSSALIQAQYDFSNSSSSNKWSSSQQVYNPNTTYRDVNFRRMKIRGKGRSVRYKFISETGKPFSIIGWSMWETGNGGV